MGECRCVQSITLLSFPDRTTTVTAVVCSVNAQATVPNRFGSSVVFAQGNFYIIGGRDANNEVSVLASGISAGICRCRVSCVMWPL